MKLKKIIPLAGIASVVAITTPLIASCSSIARIEWNKGEELPSITPTSQRRYPVVTEPATMEEAIATMESIEKATSDYFADIVKDSSLFAKDVLNYAARWPWMNREAELNKITIQINEINSNDWTVSYEVNFEGTTADEPAHDISVSILLQKVKLYVFPANITTLPYFFTDGTMVCPLIFQLNRVEPLEPFSVVLQEKVRKLLADDSWFIEYQIIDNTLSSRLFAHLDRTNVWKSMGGILNPMDMPYAWLNGSTIVQSTYLSLVKWN